MNGQTLIAWFDQASQAAAAVHALQQSDVAADLIDIRVVGSTMSGIDEAPPGRTMTGIGYWALSEKQRSNAVDRSVNGGTTIVKVKVPDGQMSRLCRIVEEHAPVRLEDRGNDYSKSIEMHDADKPSLWAA